MHSEYCHKIIHHKLSLPLIHISYTGLHGVFHTHTEHAFLLRQQTYILIFTEVPITLYPQPHSVSSGVICMLTTLDEDFMILYLVDTITCHYTVISVF